MANASPKTIGIALIVVGVGLLIWGFMTGDSVSSKISSTISGSPGDKVMMMYIGGAASLVVGLFLFRKK